MRWVIYILTLVLLACTNNKKADNQPIISHYTPKYANGFSIGIDSIGRKIITIKNPFQSDKPFTQQLYLIDSLQSAPEGQIAIKVPAQRISVLSTSHIGMLDAIGAADKVVGVSGLNFVSSLQVKQQAVEIGYDSTLDFERITAAGTDIMLLYSLYSEDTSTTEKLSRLDIPYIYIGEYIESSPLARAEWIVALAAICGLEQQGIEYFNALEKRYNTIKDSALQYNNRPKVMLNTPYQDVWFMPSVRSYAVQLITDAGAEYIYPQNDTAESLPISLEQALVLASTADVWLNVGQDIASLEELKRRNPKFASTKAVVSGRVYDNSKQGSNIWEQGVVQPDIILHDMIKLLHHNAPTDSLHYYRQLR